MANHNAQGGPGHTPGVPFTTTNSPSAVRWKWELAIRFRLKNPNAKQSEVASHIGVSPVTLSVWQADPEYVNLQNQITTGILSSIDADLAEDITHQRLTLRRLVPVALQNLADLAMQTANANLRLKASQEILDREGHLAKVTRVGLAAEAQGGVADSADTAIAAELVGALQAAKAKEEAAKKAATIDSPPASEQVQ